MRATTGPRLWSARLAASICLLAACHAAGAADPPAVTDPGKRPRIALVLDGGGAKEALRLNTHLEEIYHDASQEPGTARITIAAELVDSASLAVIARRAFTRSAPAASYFKRLVTRFNEF